MTKVQQDDKKFILNPDMWPSWPFCPIKRKNNELKQKNLGVLLHTKEHNQGKMIVYHHYMFNWPKTSEEIKAISTTEYTSVDELLADGWRVD